MRRFPTVSLLAGLAVVASLAAGCGRTADPTTAPTTATADPSPPPVPTGTGAPADDFECTLVIGFSQTMQWYTTPPGFESAVAGDRWELLWNAGASVELWGNPEYVGWSEPIVSPCTERSADPDRVLFTIGSRTLPPDPSAWADAIESAVQATRERYPGAREIILQPLVGGPGDGPCPTKNGGVVEASASHPVIDQAIAMAVGDGVVVGASPEVRACEDFQDSVGHLERRAAGPIGADIGRYYALG